ncbi:hypothetical protein B0H19DRAFT_915174, partial [Mycena capillaripes]
YPQPICRVDTRTEMLENLWNWSSDENPNNQVPWLHGPAGAGKSAVAQSFCKLLEAEGRLGAGFFFKRGHLSRGNGNKLFPMITYQLALLADQKEEHKDLHTLKQAILQKVQHNPSILDRSLLTQLEKMVVEPCQQCIPGRLLVIVIDGLDECKGKDIQQEILRSIRSVVQQGALTLRFFIASRPEPHIDEEFSSLDWARSHSSLNIHPAFNDVRKYLRDEFIRIHQGHCETMNTVSRPWPSTTDIEHLVQKSSGYFVYAFTVIKF